MDRKDRKRAKAFRHSVEPYDMPVHWFAVLRDLIYAGRSLRNIASQASMSRSQVARLYNEGTEPKFEAGQRLLRIWMSETGKNEGRLTPKQQRFIEEYVVDCNATQAAIRAGYSKKTANRIASHLLSKIDIQEAIALKRQKISLKTNYDAVSWRKDMMEIKRILSQTVVLGESEEGAVESFTDATNLMKCMDMLGKHLGAYNKDESEKDGIEKVADALMRIGDLK